MAGHHEEEHSGCHNGKTQGDDNKFPDSVTNFHIVTFLF
jgi:hypothetical protein